MRTDLASPAYPGTGPTPAPTVIMTGSSGWLGRRVRAFASQNHWQTLSVERQHTLGQVADMVASTPGKPVFLHLGWPNIPRSAGIANQSTGQGTDWPDFEERTLALQGIATRADIPFVAIGTGIENVQFTGPDLESPYAIYSARKARLRTRLLQENPALFWVRAHFLFGADEPTHRFIPSGIAAALAGRELETGRLERKRHWMDVDDFVASLMHHVRNRQTGIWDICGSDAMSFLQLGNLVGRLIGKPLKLVSRPMTYGDDGLDVVPAIAPLQTVPADAGTAKNVQQRLSRLLAHRTDIAAAGRQN